MDVCLSRNTLEIGMSHLFSEMRDNATAMVAENKIIMDSKMLSGYVLCVPYSSLPSSVPLSILVNTAHDSSTD